MAANEDEKILIGRRAKRTSCPVLFNFKERGLNLCELVSQNVVGGEFFKTLFTSLCGLKFDSYFHLRAWHHIAPNLRSSKATPHRGHAQHKY